MSGSLVPYQCGEAVEVGFGPKKVHKKNRRQG